jgi:hypothetical protein
LLKYGLNFEQFQKCEQDAKIFFHHSHISIVIPAKVATTRLLRAAIQDLFISDIRGTLDIISCLA